MIITNDGRLVNTAEDNRKVDEFLNRQPRILANIRETGEKFIMPFVCEANTERMCADA